jgi:DNA-binding NarL/FixJ family response regulator
MFSRKSGVAVVAFQRDFPSPEHHAQMARPSSPVFNAPDINVLCGALTPRQRDVLALMLQGKSNKGICRILDLAVPTVKNHVTAILRTLEVTNRVEAVIKVSGTAAALFSFAATISSRPLDRNGHVDR